MPSKNIVAYTCPEAQHALETGAKQRYMNEKIEAELVEFKEEIEKNFWKSEINRSYVFRRLPTDEAAANSRHIASINRISPSHNAAARGPLGDFEISNAALTQASVKRQGAGKTTESMAG
jgi:hypothetical protein